MPPRKRVGDLTGIETQRLQKEHQDELKKRQTEIAMMNELETEYSDIPVDYSAGPITSVVQNDLELADEIEVEAPTRTISPNTTLESVTYGQGQHYSFEEGTKYVVSLDLARHLESKGLLWSSPYR
jgi:hypothetical protein